LWVCGWHIKLITHVIILAGMKYATIYNRDYTRLEVPAVLAPPPFGPIFGGRQLQLQPFGFISQKAGKMYF